MTTETQAKQVATREWVLSILESQVDDATTEIDGSYDMGSVASGVTRTMDYGYVDEVPNSTVSHGKVAT